LLFTASDEVTTVIINDWVLAPNDAITSEPFAEFRLSLCEFLEVVMRAKSDVVRVNLDIFRLEPEIEDQLLLSYSYSYSL
jgi:hypothetical protein